MKKLLFTICGLFAIPFFSFAAISYERIPSGSGELNNPITFNVSFDDMADIDIWCNDEESPYWGLIATNEINSEFPITDAILYTDKSENFNVNLPAGNYYSIDIVCDDNDDLLEFWANSHLEYNENFIFSIIETPPSGIITMPENSSSDMVAALGTLFTDLWELIALAVGIPLAFYVIRQILRLMPASISRK